MCKYYYISKASLNCLTKKCIEFFNTRKIDKIVFASTCSNYGLIKDTELADENFVLNPLSIYAKTKVNIEKYLVGKNKNV